jgi:hypothetical protein
MKTAQMLSRAATCSTRESANALNGPDPPAINRMYQLYGSLSSFALCWARTRLFQLGESEISFDARRLIHLYNMGECEAASDTLIVAVLDGHTLAACAHSSREQQIDVHRTRDAGNYLSCTIPIVIRWVQPAGQKAKRKSDCVKGKMHVYMRWRNCTERGFFCNSNFFL